MTVSDEGGGGGGDISQLCAGFSTLGHCPVTSFYTHTILLSSMKLESVACIPIFSLSVIL
jgi:hypothetical protein